MNDQIETIVNIELQKLVPFRDHPFQVRDDDGLEVVKEKIFSVEEATALMEACNGAEASVTSVKQKKRRFFLLSCTT